MFLKPGARNSNKNNWWPQRDSNPCFSRDPFSPSILADYALFSSVKIDETKTRKQKFV
jgi:hypothetical protein